MMVYVSSVCVSAMRRASYCVHSWEAPPPPFHIFATYTLSRKKIWSRVVHRGVLLKPFYAECDQGVCS